MAINSGNSPEADRQGVEISGISHIPDAVRNAVFCLTALSATIGFSPQATAEEVRVAAEGDEAFRVAMSIDGSHSGGEISAEAISGAFTNFLAEIRFIPQEFRGELDNRFQSEFSPEAQQRVILMHQGVLPLSEDAEGEFVGELRVPSALRDRILSYVGESHATNSRTYKGVELALQKFIESKYPGDTWENLLLKYGGPEVHNIPVFHAVEILRVEKNNAQGRLVDAQGRLVDLEKIENQQDQILGN